MKEKKFAARNLSMLIDFYELTMANGYFQSGRKDTVAVFDMFFRKIPDNGGFAIFAGLEQLIDGSTELLGKLGERGHIGDRQIPLPLGNRLVGDAHLPRKIELRHTLLRTERANHLAETKLCLLCHDRPFIVVERASEIFTL